MWCQGCLRSRQAALAAGIPSVITPLGVILEDFAAPIPICVCGGDPSGPHHRDSLLHLTYSYARVLGTVAAP